MKSHKIAHSNSKKFYSAPKSLFNTFDSDTVKSLIKLGHDINEQRTTDGYTPLFSAVQTNDFNVVSNFLDYGANPAMRGKAGLSPLDLAISSLDFKPEIVNLLIAKNVYFITKTVKTRNLLEQAEIDQIIHDMQELYMVIRDPVNYDIGNISKLREIFKIGLEEIKIKYSYKEIEIRACLDKPAEKADDWEELVKYFNNYTINNQFLEVISEGNRNTENEASPDEPEERISDWEQLVKDFSGNDEYTPGNPFLDIIKEAKGGEDVAPAGLLPGLEIA